ncbi:MAG: DUF952 domain-containing protein [Cyanobacteria bacterium J06560_6]
MIFHITEQGAWDAARAAGVYRALSLETEGFIHFSEVGQVVTTANRFYKGRSGLMLLAVEENRLTSELRYEDVSEHGVFPHLFGPLNLDAVVEVYSFKPQADGTFTLPEVL